MAALMSDRAPCSSSDTIPISSVTLAWRTFVITGNLRARSQITGFVISFGGYMSQSRVFSGPADGLRVDTAAGLTVFARRFLGAATCCPLTIYNLQEAIRRRLQE